MTSLAQRKGMTNTLLLLIQSEDAEESDPGDHGFPAVVGDVRAFIPEIVETALSFQNSGLPLTRESLSGFGATSLLLCRLRTSPAAISRIDHGGMPYPCLFPCRVFRASENSHTYAPLLWPRCRCCFYVLVGCKASLTGRDAPRSSPVRSCGPTAGAV